MDTQEEFTLEDITFKNKTLAEWQDRFTLFLPELPSTNHEVQKFLAKLNNAYHIAYNQFNDLLVTCSKNERDFNEMKQTILNTIITEYKDAGVARMPSKDILSDLAEVRNNEIKELHAKMLFFLLIKEFFENHKIKLEKNMHLAGNLAYLVNGSDRTHWKAGDPTI